ncbi:TIGR02300 family protein [Methylocystis sp. B8]|uniref:TIGR02300 family protein n=1 Tax=Methylocystis sp. B8 TaxID=544938 RepID=UPI0010FED5F5|nr:TIGR02300 family protein [Methylocystis sp. B8]TLG73707.1 TIGR02300 family protein [Methylocystis sp. B8]
MVKAELGAKRRCLQCETLFFDLNRAPPACPKCQAIFVVIELPRSPPRGAAGGWKTFKKPDAAAAAADVVDLDPLASEQTEEDVVATDETEEDVVATDEEENDGVVPVDEEENNRILPSDADEFTELT